MIIGANFPDLAGHTFSVTGRVTGRVTGNSSGIGRGAIDKMRNTGSDMIERFTFPGTINNVAVMAADQRTNGQTPAPASRFARSG